jgi:hypothetical protein
MQLGVSLDYFPLVYDDWVIYASARTGADDSLLKPEVRCDPGIILVKYGAKQFPVSWRLYSYFS